MLPIQTFIRKYLFILFALVFSSFCIHNHAQAASFTLSPGVRTYPVGATVEAVGKYDQILWGEKSDDNKWKFGLVQAKATLAAHGLYDVGLSVFPISILEIGFFTGGTNRYYDSKKFNCEDYECRGAIRSEKFAIRAIGAYQDYIVSPSFYRVKLTPNTEGKLVVDQNENILLPTQGGFLDVYQILIGMKREKNIFGILTRNSQLRGAEVNTESQYLLSNMKFDDYSITAGIGRYASTYFQPALSIFAEITWAWGQNLSLF